MCQCINVEIQSYSNQTFIEYPDWFKSEKTIRGAGIDNCLVPEILSLWDRGIQTVESCCGHNKEDGYISVLNEHSDKMIALGYQYYRSNFRNESGWDENGFREDTFVPKSVSPVRLGHLIQKFSADTSL